MEPGAAFDVRLRKRHSQARMAAGWNWSRCSGEASALFEIDRGPTLTPSNLNAGSLCLEESSLRLIGRVMASLPDDPQVTEPRAARLDYLVGNPSSSLQMLLKVA